MSGTRLRRKIEPYRWDARAKPSPSDGVTATLAPPVPRRVPFRLQLQQDRLVVNWRRLPSDIPYPHYESIREFLVEAWNRLTAVVHDLGRTVPEPSICEVQYVNHLDKHSGWRSVGDTPAVIAPWDGSMSDEFLPPAREAGLSLLFELPDGRGWLAVDGRSGQLRHG